MGKAVLLLHHGSANDQAVNGALVPINDALRSMLSGDETYSVFCGVTDRDLAGKEVEGGCPDSLETAVGKALATGPDEVIVVSTFLIKGPLYQDMVERVHRSLKDSGVSFRIQPPILDTSNEESAAEFADALEMTFHFQMRQPYLLVGQGWTPEINREFNLLGEAFREDERDNVHVAVISDREAIGTIGAGIRMEVGSRLVIIKPLIIAPDPAIDWQIGDRSNADSVSRIFEDHACTTRYDRKGLGEFPEFRKALIEHYMGFIR